MNLSDGVLIKDNHIAALRSTGNTLEQLIKQARSNGIQAHSGLGMLVRQGALSFTLWTGHQPPMTVMLEAAERQLND